MSKVLFVEYDCETTSPEIDNLELEVPHPDFVLLTVRINSQTKNLLRFHFSCDASVSPSNEKIREVTSKIANNIVDQLAARFGTRITDPVHRIDNLSTRDLAPPPPQTIERERNIIKVTVTDRIMASGGFIGGSVEYVGPAFDPEELIQELESTVLEENFLWRQYRYALESRDPSDCFMFLYSILLQLNQDKQGQVDEYIRQVEPGVQETPSPKKSIKLETVYTRLRNQVGHDRGVTIADMRREMAQVLPRLKQITKGAIEQEIQRSSTQN